jgi:capsular polysaccharide biosynthesis protein
MQQSSNVSQTLIRRLWIIVLGLALGGALGALVSQQMTPIYQSNVHLLVVPASDNAGTSTANDYAQAYSKLATNPAVIGEAVRKSEVGVDPWDIEKVVSVEVSPNAPIIQITTNSPDPEDASTLANALGSGLSSFTEEEAKDTGYQADVMAAAIPPEAPALPNWTLNMAVGAAAGLLVGGVVALLWDKLGLPQLWGNLQRARKSWAEQRRAREAEKQEQRRARELEKLEKSLGRYLELEKLKPRLESEMAGLRESAERYRKLEGDKQRLESEMAALDRQRLEKGIAELRKNGGGNLELRSDDSQESRQGENGRASTGTSPLGKHGTNLEREASL